MQIDRTLLCGEFDRVVVRIDQLLTDENHCIFVVPIAADHFLFATPAGQGGQGGMAQPGGVSSLGIQSGSAVTAQDADGNTLFDGEAPCAVSTVFFSSPDLTDGETATLTSDGESVATATASTDGSGTSQTITPAAQAAAAASSQKRLVLGLVTAAGVAAVVGAAIAVKKSKKKD